VKRLLLRKADQDPASAKMILDNGNLLLIIKTGFKRKKKKKNRIRVGQILTLNSINQYLIFWE
jgi:hypothetical protein